MVKAAVVVLCDAVIILAVPVVIFEMSVLVDLPEVHSVAKVLVAWEAPVATRRCETVAMTVHRPGEAMVTALILRAVPLEAMIAIVAALKDAIVVVITIGICVLVQGMVFMVVVIRVRHQSLFRLLETSQGSLLHLVVASTVTEATIAITAGIVIMDSHQAVLRRHLHQDLVTTTTTTAVMGLLRATTILLAIIMRAIVVGATARLRMIMDIMEAAGIVHHHGAVRNMVMGETKARAVAAECKPARTCICIVVK